MSFWDAISASARNLGDSAANQAKKAKLSTDIALVDRSIDIRKRSFGVAMYDYLSPLTQSQNFYAASDKLTTLVRPLLINAQKEIQALLVKRVKQKEELAKAETNRAAAFPIKAENVGQKLINFGKAGYLHGGETKIKTELSITDRLVKGHKEDFGVSLYDAFANAEDKEGFLPTDRQIRNVYDTARGDMDLFEKQKKAKEEELSAIGGRRISVDTTTTTTMTTTSAIAPANTDTTSYGTSGVPQSTPMFTTTTQQPSAGPIMAPSTSGGVDVANFSDNNSFPINSTGYSNPSMSMTTSSTGFSNNNTPSSEQKRSSDLLLDF